eukprot:NODE_561_length_6677_cov_0.349650.p3 type:complete len:188 gc:universal NODE_561_length_6677_cov_0.349650:3111-3674(+)
MNLSPMFRFIKYLAQLFGYISVETPNYKVVKKNNDYEVREYDSQIRAITESDGLTSGSGFRKLANYIFAREQNEEKPEAIEMTAPVITTKHSMAFIMPSKYAKISELPKPEKGVTLTDYEPTTVAIKRFNGRATDEVVYKHLSDLSLKLKADGLSYDPSPSLYRYNPPHTIPWFRRNEVVCVLKHHQ